MVWAKRRSPARAAARTATSTASLGDGRGVPQFQPKNAAPQVQVFRLPMHTPSKLGCNRAKLGCGGVASSACWAASHWAGMACSCWYSLKSLIDLRASPTTREKRRSETGVCACEAATGTRPRARPLPVLRAAHKQQSKPSTQRLRPTCIVATRGHIPIEQHLPREEAGREAKRTVGSCEGGAGRRWRPQNRRDERATQPLALARWS